MFRTIKELVVHQYNLRGAMPPYDDLTSVVRQHFPQSRWKETHYSWYKSAINTGRISVSDTPGGDEPDDIDTEVESAIEARVSLERDLRDFLARNLTRLEPGLNLRPGGVEYHTNAGRIDILAADCHDRSVVIELKAGRATDSAFGQFFGRPHGTRTAHKADADEC
jgi:hypothetical protein